MEYGPRIGGQVALWHRSYGPDRRLSPAEVDQACAGSPGAFAMLRRGLAPAMPPAEGLTSFHREIYGLLVSVQRLCIIAPRLFGKSEMIVCWITWRLLYQPGTQALVLGATELLASKLKLRIDDCVAEVALWLHAATGAVATRSRRYTNGSYLEAAGAGSAMRGAHPDVVVGDDLLTEEHAWSSTTRRRTIDWWMASVGGMAHPGVTRVVQGRRLHFPPTSIVCMGTPFHNADLLYSLRTNGQYKWFRYAAAFDPDALPAKPSCAVQVGEHQGRRTGERRDVRQRIRDHHAVDAAKRKVEEEAPQRLGLQQLGPFGDRNAPPPEGVPRRPERPRVQLRDRL